MKMIQDKIKWTKYLNIIFLILEYPVAFLLSIFTLDGDACKLSFQSNPWEQFGSRFLFVFVPLLVINVIISIIIKLLFKYYARRYINLLC